MNQPQIENCTDAEFLGLLSERSIQLRVHEGRLRINAPTGAMDDWLKAEMGRRKAMLLAHCLHAGSVAPLSFAQERLWVLERFHPGNFAYNIPDISDIQSRIDPDILQRAIDLVVRRHGALRTSIREDRHGVATQHIDPQVQAVLQVFDFRSIEPEARETQLQKTLRDLTRLPFDLRTAPLVRFYLIQMASERHVVFINIHHIVSDKWSMRLLLRELLAAYNAYATGKEPTLAVLPIQFADHARAERLVPTMETQKHLQYWTRTLADLPEPPQLPYMLKPAVQKPFEGAIFPLDLTNDDTNAIRSMARLHQVSPYILLLTAYVALLHRLTGVTDLCVGSPVSGRNHSDTEALIGMFVNTLVMRCTVPPQSGFLHLLRNIRETVLEAQSHHDVPLQRILSELLPDGAVTAHALFETVMAFDSFVGGITAPDSSGSLLDPGSAKFHLTLQMYEDRDRIGGFFEYRTDLFTQASIAKIAEAFVLLLRHALANPAIKVAELEIVPAAERVRLLREWNSTDMPFPDQTTIHKLFEQQVNATPDATAVIFQDERVSYAELNRRANRIANRLLTQEGVGPETIVGVHMERTPMLLAAMLGILKTGAAYLPLDTQYPQERLQFMVEDSKAAIILSDSWSSDLPHGGSPSEKIRLLSTACFGCVDPAKEHNPGITVQPENLAYVIYTSGSTGRPKGVALEHRNTVAFLAWCRTAYPPELLRGMLASTSISFDLSIFEIFLPLICGHTVILARDVLELASLPAVSEVTLVMTVPSAAAALLETKGIPATLQAINLAGELLSANLVDRLYAETSVTAVFDSYGPTETTTFSTFMRRSPGAPAMMGRPIGNTRIYLVDQSLQLVPLGMPGEVMIAGAGVTRGYLGRPELTRERFITLKHLGEREKAYRTGDLCCYNDDGVLVYLGRLDQQVKIRGFRVEIGEVEAALSMHPSIDGAVVFVRTDEDANTVLVAAVRLRQEHSLDLLGLIAHQSKILPAYMVARSIFVVTDFPRTASGKVDRKSVALLTLSNEGERHYEAPTNALERELALIWQQGFGTGRIGIDEDFFQLGGHSLLALRIFSDIEKKMGCRIMLSVLFQASTVRSLAEYMRMEKLA